MTFSFHKTDWMYKNIDTVRELVEGYDKAAVVTVTIVGDFAYLNIETPKHDFTHSFMLGVIRTVNALQGADDA